ncbi:heme exporter protein CcmD [Lysobacter sp. A3-1-A15]|uniref:heme exporter protein CcmD n=1 Tax=Novilysobacter viscosus TaxID=3098602 RepID=UPI002ED896B8
MTYLEYVVAAYVVFVLVMAYELIVPHLQIRRARRAALLRAARTAPRRGPHPPELTR